MRLGLTGTDVQLWEAVDVAALDLAERLAGGPGAPPGTIEYLINGAWTTQRPIDCTGVR